MSFLTEPEPKRGEPSVVAPGITRIVANNPGVMTYWGTNTYLLDTAEGVAILDPGPDDPHHVAAVLAAIRGPVSAIILSHTHADHLGATAALTERTGAPVHAWHRPAEPGFQPDVPLQDGDQVSGLVALHTPGHASDHLCFAGPNGVLFSADHVMGWSSSVIPPPDGNMSAYFRSLDRLLARDETTYLPGHGPPLPTPHAFMQDLLAHRRSREAAILDSLNADPCTTTALVDLLYSKADPILKRAAERNVVAHLEKLREEGRAAGTPEGWVRA